GGSRHEYAAFQRVIDLLTGSGCHSGQKTGMRLYRLFPGIHQKEAAGTVCVFDIPCFKAALSEQRRLLISRRPGDGDLSAQKITVCHAVDTAAWLYLRKHLGRNLKIIQYFFIPSLAMDIVKHG